MRSKALPTILVACLILPIVLSSIPAQAACAAADSQGRAASLAKTGATVRRQIDQLSRRASVHPHSAWLRRHVVRTDRCLTSLTRKVNGLNSDTLALSNADAGTYNALLDLNAPGAAPRSRCAALEPQRAFNAPDGRLTEDRRLSSPVASAGSQRPCSLAASAADTSPSFGAKREKLRGDGQRYVPTTLRPFSPRSTRLLLAAA